MRSKAFLAPSLHSGLQIATCSSGQHERNAIAPARISSGKPRTKLHQVHGRKTGLRKLEGQSETTARRVPLLAPRGDGMLHSLSAKAFLFSTRRSR